MSGPDLFFDNSALFAGIASASGASRALLLLAEAGQVSITISEQVVAETERAVADALLFYKIQNIPCPFLRDNICTIHEVRPFTCALHFATTPAEWCHPRNPDRAKVYKATVPSEMFDLSFYYGQLREPVFSFMPLTVYEILKSGFLYLSRLSGPETLASEAMNDPEVRAILERY